MLLPKADVSHISSFNVILQNRFIWILHKCLNLNSIKSFKEIFATNSMFDVLDVWWKVCLGVIQSVMTQTKTKLELAHNMYVTINNSQECDIQLQGLFYWEWESNLLLQVEIGIYHLKMHLKVVRYQMSHYYLCSKSKTIMKKSYCEFFYSRLLSHSQ